MAVCSNNNNDDENDSTFILFSKNLLKTFVLLSIICMTISLKKTLISGNISLFTIALFVVSATLLFTIIGIVDQYIYNNLILGIGIAVGLVIMDWREVANAASATASKIGDAASSASNAASSAASSTTSSAAS